MRVRRELGWLALAAALVAGSWAAGCGNNDGSGFDDSTLDGGDGNGEGGGGLFGGGGNQDGAAKTALVVTPANPVLNATAGGPAVTQQFKATPQGSSTSVGATWSIDNVALGTIDNNGLFTASGTAGGQATITAQAGNVSGTTTVTVHLTTTENPGNVSMANQGLLNAGGKSDATFAWLYPYDQTVFPRGLLPPALQFAGQASTAAYVHITTKNLDYKGYFGASNPVKIALSPATWKTITGSAGPSDPVNVEVTTISGTAVTGPIKESWTIAQGNLKGTVYYNTYNSPMNNSQGAVMQVKPGASATMLSTMGTCTVCHAVSADGSTLVTMGGGSGGTEYQTGEKVDLSVTPAKVTPRGDDNYGFGGVYPDGSKILTSAAVGGGYPPNIPGVSGTRASALIDLKTASTLPATGLAGNMLMPSFSADGKKVAFNHYDTTKGHTLAVLDFDTTKNAFANPTDIVTDMTSFLGWPAFMPDTKSFVFGSIDSSDYATWQSHHGDLYAVDLATKTRVALDAANGMKGGTQYIPYGAADLHLNYEPTSLPLAVGGYYWVVFTSRRQVGNTIVMPNGGNATSDPWSNTARKKLWVVAIDMNPAAGADPSHPPFYLEGQELGAGNMRGFWALDPCHQNGNSCESGDECCTGFCRQVNGADGGSMLTCVAPPMGCSNEFEKCTTVADCCGAGSGVACIAGHCATSGPK